MTSKVPGLPRVVNSNFFSFPAETQAAHAKLRGYVGGGGVYMVPGGEIRQQGGSKTSTTPGKMSGGFPRRGEQ